MTAQRIVIDVDGEDVEQQVLILTDEIQSIEAQLGADGPRHEDGSVYTEEEFREWRARALTALNRKRSMKRHLQKVVTDRRRKENGAGAKLHRLTKLAWRVVALFRVGDSTAQAMDDLERELREQEEQ